MAETVKKRKPLVILLDFFGLHNGQTKQEFIQELKALTKDEKLEMASLAAAELGVEVDIS
jgi:hypothetical protein